MSGKSVSPFVQFIIGGDYRIEFKKTTDGSTVRDEVGDMGAVFKTNVISNLNERESQDFTTHIYTEYRCTYYEVMRNRLHFEIWTWNKWLLNRFMAIKSIPLIEVCNGSINKDISFTHFDGRNEIPV